MARKIYTFKDVLDRSASTLWKDYKLDSLYKTDQKIFYEFLSGFLVNSCDMFDGCLSDLSYHDEVITLPDNTEMTIPTFDNPLESKEVYILCLGVCIGWYGMQKEDVTQFALHLSSRDFKSFSEANNLKMKQETFDRMKENFEYEIVKYQSSKLESLPFFNGGV